MAVTVSTIESAILEMKLEGKDIAVHSSLNSFGHVMGGASAVVEGILKACGTVLMPAFCGLGRCNAPPNDRPSQNAWNYDAQPARGHISPFDPATFDLLSEIDTDEMGRIPAAFLAQDDTVRSQHPSVSWAANGPRSQEYTADHRLDDPNYPIKRLVGADGHVILLGVGLASCTAVHYAEELAGRRPFIRWVLFADGEVHRIREYGCSDAFTNLAPVVESMATHHVIGRCSAVSYPIRPFVEILSETIKAKPDITLCGDADCRCVASMLGGPIE